MRYEIPTGEKRMKAYNTERIESMIEYLQGRMKRISSYSKEFEKLSSDIAPLFAEMAKRQAA